jgi:hypothetical protein
MSSDDTSNTKEHLMQEMKELKEELEKFTHKNEEVDNTSWADICEAADRKTYVAKDEDLTAAKDEDLTAAKKTLIKHCDLMLNVFEAEEAEADAIKKDAEATMKDADAKIDAIKKKKKNMQSKRDSLNDTEPSTDDFKEHRQQQPEPARHKQHSDSNVNDNTYKKNLCSFYLKGNCTKGKSCTFAHGDNDIQDIKKTHNNTKTKICTKWEKGTCTFGENCRFAHGDNDIQDNKKTQICNNWEKGTCKYGETCHFAHGDEELRNINTSNGGLYDCRK